jgi:hypothetical protein
VIDLDVIVVQDSDAFLGRIGGAEKRERMSHTNVGRVYTVSYYIAGRVRCVKIVLAGSTNKFWRHSFTPVTGSTRKVN